MSACGGRPGHPGPGCVPGAGSSLISGATSGDFQVPDVPGVVTCGFSTFGDIRGDIRDMHVPDVLGLSPAKTSALGDIRDIRDLVYINPFHNYYYSL